MKKLLNLLIIFAALTGGKIAAQCAGCPTVDAQVATGPSTYICSGQTVALSASNTPILGANTSTYTVAQIPYAALPFTGGNLGVNNCDDCWGSVQNMPFPFCFYGVQRNQFVVGSNGVLTFDPTAAGYCPWPINTGWPSLGNIVSMYDIGVPYRDIVTNGSQYAHWYVTGSAPTRTMVIYWDNIPYFSCGSPGGFGESSQILLMESTQIIEVHVLRSNACAGWNGGAGILGIQNNPNPGTIAPARNFPGAWSANNEAWRFSPIAPVPSYTWFGPGGQVGTGTTVVVSPSVTTTYSAQVLAGCNQGGTVQVVVNSSPTLNPSSNSPICQGSALNLTAGGGGANTTYSWTGPGSYTANVQNPSIANAQPTMSGTYSLVAANNYTNGPSCFASGSTQVNVIPVNQTSVTPNFTLCQGSNLNLTAQNAVPPSAYMWNGPNNFTSTTQNPIINGVLPVNAGNYVVTASFVVQGVTLVCTSTAVTNVSVVATSPVTVNLPNNICEHGTAMLTATTNPMAPAFSWNGPNGFTATGSNTSIVNIPASATGLYNVTATWAIGSVSCSIPGANQINVVPVAPINVNAPITVCDPSNVQLTASSPGAISYSWSASNGFTSNIASPLLSAPGASASGVYTITTAYTNGALVCYNNNTTQVTVNPILTFTLPAYKQQCFNSIYSINGPAGATSYTWSGPGGYTNNNQILSIPSIQSGQAGTYTLTVNLGPCTTSASTKVDVLSPISFTQTPGNKVICAGENVTLTVGSTGGSQNYAYNWNPAIYLGSPTGSVQYGQPQGTTIYNVTAYDITCPNYTISSSFTVTVNKAPLPDLQLQKTEGCQPLCLTYNSRTQSQADMITYDFGNGQLMQADSFAYCLNEPGTYTLRINTRGKNGCNATYTHPAPIVVWPTPHSDFGWDPDAPTVTNNHLTFLPSNQYGPVVSYQWQFSGANGASGNDTSSFRNPVRTYDNAGKYPVMLVSTTDKGCADTIFKVIDLREDFTIFIPNSFTPNGDGLNDVFNVKGLGLKTEGYSMEIFDRWGALVYSTKDAYKGWDGMIKGLYAPSGVYVYKVKALGSNGEGKKEFVGHVTLMK